MKRGPAASLPGKLWAAWTQHLLATGPTWVWVAVVLTHILCCRITEVLSLRKRDFDFKKRCVTVRALKRQPQVQPQFGKAVLKTSVQNFILTNQPVIKISIIQPNMGLIHPIQILMRFPSFLQHTSQCTWTCTFECKYADPSMCICTYIYKGVSMCMHRYVYKYVYVCACA